MEQKDRSLNYYMRLLHRDIGFFIIGFIAIYSISGIVLIYRDTDFLKEERVIEKNVGPNIEIPKLGMMLHMRDFKVISNDGDVVSFNNGTYNKATGVVKYSSKELPVLLDRFTGLHKTSSGNINHYLPVLFGVVLLFMAVSSFWMFKRGTRIFRRGVFISVAGIIVAVILCFV